MQRTREAEMNGNQTRELDFRAVDGLEVALLWHTETNRLTVSVFDSKNDDDFEIEVSSSDAMDAFHHPRGSYGPLECKPLEDRGLRLACLRRRRACHRHRHRHEADRRQGCQ